MKYVIVLGDGMADEPIESLGGRTPLAVAHTPNMDELAKRSVIGMAQTIPEGMKPGSDTANLSVLGYNPRDCYSGRSPLEALSIGVPMEETDIAIRCNFVTISQEDIPFEEQRIIDHSSSEISTEDCAILLDCVKRELEKDGFLFYLGTSYRHCLIWKNGNVLDFVQPHDILGRVIGEHLPAYPVFRSMMEKSYAILKDHPLNKERIRQGLNPANCCWFWGAGTKPNLPNFLEKNGIRGAMISAVDLLKGIAVGAGMDVIVVEGANGSLHTNYEGKWQAAIDALYHNNVDFVYIHIEAPDEMGHQGELDKKIQAIEWIDTRIVGPLYEEMSKREEEFAILILPDHPTPISIRTHTDKPVPYLLYRSNRIMKNVWRYHEEEAEKAGGRVCMGWHLLDLLLDRPKK